MNNNTEPCCQAREKSRAAEQLNQHCFCKTFDASLLENLLGTSAAAQPLLATYPQFFSNTAVFISADQLNCMQRLINAIEQVIALPAYRAAALAKAPENAHIIADNPGVFMGYDFHMSERGPQLIEINTNAGGGFLNAVLANAQISCCNSNAVLFTDKQQLDREFTDMFMQEWRSLRSSSSASSSLPRLAIVDDKPQQQFLYPEFKLAQGLFERQGISAVIAAPEELEFNGTHLLYKNEVIDLVYNRLTDFPLTEPGHQAILEAFKSKAIVLTPAPFHHALYADKRNLALLSDAANLSSYGLSESQIQELLTGIPKTQIVSPENADNLWQNRKQLFFKPTGGFGSRATYRGDKLTQRVWQQILNEKYIAQTLVAPSERGMLVDGMETALKTDIRAYVYKGKIQLLAARLYQGQTTNFRTTGGGFAPVFIQT